MPRAGESGISLALSVGRHFPSKLLTLTANWQEGGGAAAHVSEDGAFCELRRLPRDAAQPFPAPAVRRLLRASHHSWRVRTPLRASPHAAEGREVLSGPAVIDIPGSGCRQRPPHPGAASGERGLLPPFVPRGSVPSD